MDFVLFDISQNKIILTLLSIIQQVNVFLYICLYVCFYVCLYFMSLLIDVLHLGHQTFSGSSTTDGRIVMV